MFYKPVALLALAVALDAASGAGPAAVSTTGFRDRERIVANWGHVGPTLRRQPEEVSGQFERLKAYLHSPEVVAMLEAEQKRMVAIEEQLGKQQGDARMARYRTEDQDPGVPRVASRTRSIQTPEWIFGIPWDVRKQLVVAAFDARDGVQVAWARRVRALHPTAAINVVGWHSQAALDAVQEETPDLRPMSVVSVPGGASAADWLGDWGIEGLPALVRWTSPEEQVMEEGL
ncbi:MAG: hypothetical protein PF961_10480 [Planctomycetota bacterium]|jgi:hypothetical protein|nr:hypothetical protein [Planctomycetota bacterium]